VGRRLRWRRVRERRVLLERTVRRVLVVMDDVGTHDLLELASADDQDPVEAQLRSVRQGLIWLRT
jgi:hypothetical protein